MVRAERPIAARCDLSPGIRIPSPIPCTGWPGLIDQPVFFEPHRADVGQPRVQSYHLQRPKQRLAAGAVPAVPATAHRGRDAVFDQHVAEVLAGVLAAPVAMEEQSPPSLPGWRLNHAIRSASMTMSRVMSWRSLQPGTWRLDRSMTTAGNSHPSSVAMKMMSPAQTVSGSATLSCRSSRLGAIGRSCEADQSGRVTAPRIVVSVRKVAETRRSAPCTGDSPP